MRAPPGIDVVARHPVPMRLRGARGGWERVVLDAVSTAGRVRGVSPDDLADRVIGEAYGGQVVLFEGRLWEPVHGIETDEAGTLWCPLDLADALAILEGRNEGHPANDLVLGHPFAPANPNRAAPAWDPRIAAPDRLRGRLVEDLEPLARAAVGRGLERDLLHDGRWLYRSLPSPKLRPGWSPEPGTSRQVTEACIPEARPLWLGAWAGLDRGADLDGVLDVLRTRTRYRMVEYPNGRGLPLERALALPVAPDAWHVAAFANQVPVRLAQVLASLDRIALAPGADGLADEARGHRGRLAPWFARGVAGLVGPGDWAEAAGCAVRAAGFLALMRGDAASREEMEVLAAHGRLVVLPAIPADGLPAEDIGALSALAV